MIDHRDGVSAAVFICVPDAALKQWDPERGEVIRVNQHHTGLRHLATCCSVYFKRLVTTSVGRRSIHAARKSGDARYGCDLLPYLLDVTDSRFARLSLPLVWGSVAQLDAEPHDICGIVA